MGSVWKELRIKNEIYAISSVFERESWKISLTNLLELYIETLCPKQIVQRCQKLNPLLSTEDFNIDSLISKMFNDIPCYAVEVSSPDTIKLQTVVEGGFFKFQIKFFKATPHQFWSDITRPLCHSIANLQRQTEVLIKTIKNKDQEIQEYKACGAELLRKHIATKPFSDDILNHTMGKNEGQSFVLSFLSIANKYRSMELQEVKEKPKIEDNTNEVGGKRRTEELTEPKIVIKEAENHSKTAIEPTAHSTSIPMKARPQVSVQIYSTNQNKRQKTLSDFKL